MALEAESSRKWVAKREMIMSVATNLFADRGIDSVSMRDVGTACDLNIATLYHYFESKDDLYQQTLLLAFNGIASQVSATVAVAGTPTEKLQKLLQTLTNFFFANGAMVRLLEREFLQFNQPKHRRSFPEAMREAERQVIAVLEDLKPPIIERLSARRLGEMLWDIAWGVIRHAPAHAAVMSGKKQAITKKEINRELWELYKKILDIRTDDLPVRRRGAA